MDQSVCLPITDLQSVLDWTPSTCSWGTKVINKSVRSTFCYRGSTRCGVSNEKIPTAAAPKTLFCHDMKGGYLEDKYVDGSEKYKEFRFIHWSCIDIFVYFSHKFVTVPPLAWINSGHLHGVSVLGTIITEWNDGEEMWKKILSDPPLTLTLCEKLSEICCHYGFDGYLLNIENEIEPSHVFSLLDFVKILKSTLSSMKSDSLVIWYDSVTLPTGKLKYQNRLNGYNHGFFEGCDGIFLNYNWSKEDLRLSATNSGDRQSDVFVGVDVFGRGCYGGGGFSSHLAVEMASMHSLSVALFAGGWVHETSSEEDTFEERDFKLWSTLYPILYNKGPSQLPFVTSFCQGYGERLYKDGLMVSETPWYNLSKQSYQVTDLVGYDRNEHCLCHYNKNAFNGGSCLLIRKCNKPQDLSNGAFSIHRLFLTEFKLLSETICLSVTTSPVEENTRPELVILFNIENSDGKINRKIFCSRENMEKCTEISDFVLPKKTNELFENGMSSWSTRKYELRIDNGTIVGVGCALVGDGTSILLGELGIHKAEQTTS